MTLYSLAIHGLNVCVDTAVHNLTREQLVDRINAEREAGQTFPIQVVKTETIFRGDINDFNMDMYE